MKQIALKITPDQLKQFNQLESLSSDDANELLRTSIVCNLSAGTPVFRHNDTDRRTFFLLEGEVALLTDQREKIIIRAGTPEAKAPLGHHIEGQMLATALKNSVLLAFDSDMLELFINWTNPDAYVVDEVSENEEWLKNLFQTKGLLRFSEDQIQMLLERMKEVHYKAGDVVINQDDNDDYYYIIKSGRCQVSRKPDPEQRGIKLAELAEGDAFGEEALLTNAPRNATVTMKEDGNLMRLSKTDFSDLLAQPLLKSIVWDDIRNLIKQGAIFLDVRLPEEFNHYHLQGSLNIPLALLRLRVNKLNKKRKYIIYSNDGGRSAVAAFILNRYGYDAYIIDGGIAAIAQAENGSSVENIAEIIRPTKSNTQPQSKTQRSRKPKSFADHWGSTVDEDEERFEDSTHVESLGKTQPIKVSELHPPITNNDGQRPVYATDTLVHGKRPPIMQKTKAVKKRRGRNSGNRRAILLGVLLIVATYAAQQYNPALADTMLGYTKNLTLALLELLPGNTPTP